MFSRSTGWLWTATICQALVHALHGQTAGPSTVPSPSPSSMQPVSEPEEWKVEGPSPEQQLPGIQQPQFGSEQMPEAGPGAPFEPEPGWSGGLINSLPENSTQFQLPPEELPVDPRSAGWKFSVGPIDIRPLMQFTTEYSDNILASTSNRRSDVIYIIAPGATLAVGDYMQKDYSYLTLTYVPTLNLYNHFSSLNSLDQHLRIDGQYGLERLKLSGYFGYDKAFGGNRDIGGLVNSDYYTMGGAAKYLINEQLSLEALGDQIFAHYQNAIGSNTFINHDWLNYNFTPKLVVSAGGAFGLLQPGTGGTQTFEQGLVRLQFASTDKLAFYGEAGFEVRQFPSGKGIRVTPVFDLSATYQLFPGTTVGLSGARNVTYSASVTGSNYTATSVSASITQHLVGNLYIGLDAGFENDAYFQVSGARPGTTQRQDNYVILRPNLTYRWNDWANISVSYFYRDNHSNSPGRSFYNNQIAVQMHVGF
jgi:hypothetical protein